MVSPLTGAGVTAALCQELAQALRQQPVFNCDETGHRTQTCETFRLFVDLSTRIRGSWSSCNPMKIGVFLSFARSISRFCGGRLRGPRSWMGGLLGDVHA